MNISIVEIINGPAAHKNHGRYLPHLEILIVSHNLPIMGSLISSQILAPMNISMMNNGLKLKMSV